MCHGQQKSEEAQELGQALQQYVSPLRDELDRQIDRQLVKAFLLTWQANHHVSAYAIWVIVKRIGRLSPQS